MIEGLRLLPFVADLPAMNCATCLNGDPKNSMPPVKHMTRLLQGCGYEPRHPRARVPVPVGYDGEVTVCPGYTTSLPEVHETVRYRPQWLKGTYALAVRGRDVFEDLGPALDAQAILEGAVTTKQNHDTAESARRAKEAGNG